MTDTPKPAPPDGRPLRRSPEQAEAAITAAFGPSGWITTAAGEELLASAAAEEPTGERLHRITAALRAAAGRIGGDTGRQLAYAADNSLSAARLAPLSGEGSYGAFRAFLVSAEEYVDQARRVRPYELRGEVPARGAGS